MSKIFSPQDKLIANIENVIEFLRTGNTSPVLVEFDPSNICNHSCSFCLSSHIHFEKFRGTSTYDHSVLSREKMLEICKDLIEMKVKAINWTGGGEPTINPSLKEIITYIGENSPIKMGMFTNGTLLDKFDLFGVICKYFSWLRFSVDAGTEDSYNQIRITNKNNNWNKMLENVGKLIEEKKQRNSYLVIGAGFVITEYNYKEVVAFADTFNRFDVDYCQFKPEITVIEKGGEQDRVNFWKNEVMPQLVIAKEILGNKYQINHYKLDDLVDNPETFGRNYKKCLGSQIQPCIGADGHVYICPNHRGHKKYSYGNVNEKSFKDVWNDMQARNRVRSIIEDVECFSNCTALCKPHEVNKKMWEIEQKWSSLNENDKMFYEQEMFLESNRIKPILTHPEFI